MSVAVKFCGRANHAKVYISAVVKDGTAAGASPDEGDVAACVGLGVGDGGEVVEETEIDFQPGILVAADDDARVIGVEEQDVRIWMRVL